MKKLVSVLGIAQFILIILLPLGMMVSDFLGYTFELSSYPVFAIVTALLSVSTVALCVITNAPVENKAVEVLFALASLLSLINTAIYLLKCSTVLVAVSMLICFCCCGYLTIGYGNPVALKIVGLLLSTLMIFPTFFLGFIALVFGVVGQNSVVQSVKSPNGEYCASVINSDRGALGGDTFVDVYDNKEIDAFIFKFSKNPQRIYHGDWGEFEDMTIYWKDDHCLVINSVEYTIK